MDAKTCFGCKNALPNKEYMNCDGCKQKYDLQCANLSPKRFKKLTTELKRGWRCIECTSKLPKQGNSNTPVRGSSSVPHLLKPLEDTDTDPPSDSSAGTAAGVSTRRQKARVLEYVTEDKIRDIWKYEMRKELEIMLEDTIKRTVSSQLNTINEQCTGFQESIVFVSGQYEDLRKEISELKKMLSNSTVEVKNLKEENKNLKDSLSTCMSRIKLLEDEHIRQQQWARMQNIEITGIPEKSDENTCDIVRQVTQHIGITLQPADMEFAHRVQPRRAASAARGRPIVVRLSQRAVKDQIIAAARKRRSVTAADIGIGAETNRVFINEHLTKDTKMLLSACKLKAKESSYKYIWTKNCRIYVRKNEGFSPLPINSSSDLAKIV